MQAKVNGAVQKREVAFSEREKAKIIQNATSYD